MILGRILKLKSLFRKKTKLINNMKISIIAALSVGNFAIGRNGKLCYHISDDLRRFKALTMGHPIVMGRKTWESLPHALSGRTNIVITSGTIDVSEYDSRITSVVGSLEEALKVAETSEGSDEVFIIGGGMVYKQALPFAQTLYLTEIFDTPFDADTFFPPYHADFTCKERSYIIESGLRYEFTRYERDDT